MCVDESGSCREEELTLVKWGVGTEVGWRPVRCAQLELAREP